MSAGASAPPHRAIGFSRRSSEKATLASLLAERPEDFVGAHADGSGGAQ